jgi:hypothetical protein
MWIATNTGFLSIVQGKKADYARYCRDVPVQRANELPELVKYTLCIRSRSRADLVAIIAQAMNWTAAKTEALVVEWPGRDYPVRIFLHRDHVANMIAASVRGIGYENFKDSVKSDPLHDAYMAVWSAMNKYGRGGFGRIAQAVKPAPKRIKARPMTDAENASHNAKVQHDIDALDREHDDLYGFSDLKAR